MSKTPLTVIGAELLRNELHRLKTVERPSVINAISEARAQGDLSENAEYDAAKERQGFVEGRIKEVEDKLARAQVVDTSTIRSDKVMFGAKVEVKDLSSDEIKIFHIVGTDESDAKLGRLSIESPIVRQLINKTAGDSVVIRVPKGEVAYEILSVRYE